MSVLLVVLICLNISVTIVEIFFSQSFHFKRNVFSSETSNSSTAHSLLLFEKLQKDPPKKSLMLATDCISVYFANVHVVM